MLFTGYEMTEINEKGMSAILDFTDILITGRYEESRRTIKRQWIGSTNQQIHFLSERYKDYQIENANYVELTLEENGKCTMLGFPEEIKEIIIKNQKIAVLIDGDNAKSKLIEYILKNTARLQSSTFTAIEVSPR